MRVTALAPQGSLDLGDMALEYRWIAPMKDGAPTLVFLHEGLGCVALWRDFPDRIARETGCGAFIYSRQGYGGSSPVAVPRPLDYMHREGLDVLPRILTAAGLANVILIGHSDGASIAIIYAGSNPAVTPRGAALLAPHVFNEEVCVASIRASADVYRHGDLRARLKRLHGDNVDGAFWGWNGAWLDPDFMNWNIEEYLPNITVPLMVIQGADDEYGTSKQYEAIAVQSGGPVEVLTLADCRHSPHRDQPDLTASALTRFIHACMKDDAP